MKSIINFYVIALTFILIVLFSSCNKDTVTNPTELTDEQYMQLVALSGYSNVNTDEDNLMSQDITDIDTSITGDDNSPYSPIDSLRRWGRRIVNVDISTNFSGNDTLRYLAITRTITGNYIINGYVGGVLETVSKPYKEVLTRNVVFKRIDRTPHPGQNWRVFQVSPISGGTTDPQNGSALEQISKIEVYKNGSLTPTYSINGPDFQNFYWTTRRFDGAGIPSVNRGDQIQVKIYVNSQSAQPNDIVDFHWARNTFGFHRVAFSYEGMSGSSKVYSKSFLIYQNHRTGNFNGYFSASTHESLYDDDVTKFASDEVGIPYRVVQ